MKPIIKRLSAFLATIHLLALLIAGCAATAIDEQEGGISGTGDTINCADEKNRKHPLCRQN